MARPAPAPAWLVDPAGVGSPTLTIDTSSAPGSWARAIRDTPHLARQMPVEGSDAGSRP